VWIAASTMPPARPGDVDEDNAVLDAFEELSKNHPGLLLLLVPRKPEQFDEAAGKLSRRGIRFARRSQLNPTQPLALPGVLLVDTIGELAGLFGLANVVFLGGTLADRGGHNILEPALCGVPVILGPHMENFPEIAAEFDASGASVRISKPSELAAAVSSLLEDPDRAIGLGEKSKALAEAKRGVTARTIAEILRLRDEAIPQPPSPLPGKLLLWPLARIWELGGFFKRGRDLAHQGRLTVPVVSVGGLAMGGTGKTPLVIWLARQVRDAGRRVAVLTRGYGRQNPADVQFFAPGEEVSSLDAGDEPLLIVRSSTAAVGVGADRYETGSILEERYLPDLFLLDDGFQHARLARDLDIVLMDALNPLAGGDLFPHGRLRELPEALARAHAIVLTRCEPDRHYTGLKDLVRRYNPEAPIFQSQVVPESWLAHPQSSAAPAREFGIADFPFRNVAAFCGVANPSGFRQVLASLGLRPVYFKAFPDHHHYSSDELGKLADACRKYDADALLTTEKDLINCFDEDMLEMAGIPLYALRIGMEVADAEGLLALLPLARPSDRQPRVPVREALRE
jgi:3-deoxy-D-manno-octulosonic-acid transferase